MIRGRQPPEGEEVKDHDWERAVYNAFRTFPKINLLMNYVQEKNYNLSRIMMEEAIQDLKDQIFIKIGEGEEAIHNAKIEAFFRMKHIEAANEVKIAEVVGDKIIDNDVVSS